MLRTHTIRFAATFIALILSVIISREMVAQAPLAFTAKDYDGKSQSLAKAELTARKFIADPGNKGKVDVLKSQYFVDAFKKDYPVQGGGKVALYDDQTYVAALIVALEMKSLANDPNTLGLDDAKLQREWMKKQSAVIDSLHADPNNPVLIDDGIDAWKQFLLQWCEDGASKGKFRDALSEAPFEILTEVIRRLDKAAERSPGGQGGSGTKSKTGPSSSTSGGAYSPFHERMMNHIYHHNDRQMAKAERIRARR